MKFDKKKNEICWRHYEGIIRVLGKACFGGMIDGKRDRGRQRRTWGDDLKEWSGRESIGGVGGRYSINDILRIGIVGGSL